MHYTEPVYRNPYWPSSPLLEITRGCSYNKCKFCTMYKGVKFGPAPLDEVEEDIKEIARLFPDATRIQLLSADPFCLPHKHLKEVLELINRYLPNIQTVTAHARVTNVMNKTVEQLKELKELKLNEISLGTESGDDWTLERINKGYRAKDIVEQCAKLDEAGIAYWHTFLNGVAGRSHSKEHAINSAKIYNQTNPIVVGTGGLTLFPDVELGIEAKRGEFDPLTEREMMEELYLFLDNLEVGERFITHHTSGANLTGKFLDIKPQVLARLRQQIDSLDEDYAALCRSMKTSL